MENILLEYLRKIQDLTNYIDEMEEIGKLLSNKYTEQLSLEIQKLYREPSKRIYDYNLIIITLYGILEGFIEQLIEKYLIEISTLIKDYKDLPEEIKENHLMLSAELIINSKKLAKYSNVVKQDVIRNLWSCTEIGQQYRLNEKAFTNHSSNFRKDTIRDIFKNIGVENITAGIIRDDGFKSYFMEVEGAREEDLNLYGEDAFYSILHDIVERRNYIAHGSDIDDILSLSILKSYVLYIRALIESIYKIIYRNLNILRIEKGEKIALGFPVNVYNKSIVGLYNHNNELKRGMFIFAENPDTGKIHFGKIISIENNRKKVTSVSAKENILLGIQVDFIAKKNYNFGILK